MKKLIGVIAAIAVLAIVSIFGWRFFKSSNEPLRLTPAQAKQTLEASEPSIRAAGFNMRITNKSSKRVKAQFLVSASVEQNGVTVKDGSRDITEIWEPQEIKEILIPYNHADKPYNDSGARRVYYSANSLETPK